MSVELKFAINLAREAGALIFDASRSEDLILDLKNNVELVTSADTAVDLLICERIKSKFPNHIIISEESSPNVDSVLNTVSPFWIVDPIDGTVNFAHGLLNVVSLRSGWYTTLLQTNCSRLGADRVRR